MFIDSAVGFINRGLGDNDNMVQAVVNLQIAMELALKSSVVFYCGIKTILVERQCHLPDEDIEKLFYDNKLKIREYESIKNFASGRENLYDFEREDRECMKIFQNYRNNIMHSSYIFSDEEKENIESNIIHALIHILGVLLSDSMDHEDQKFMQEYLKEHEYSVLRNNPIYNAELKKYLHQHYRELYTCPCCFTKTLIEINADDYKCARCFEIFSDEIAYAFVKCAVCKEDMVICDALNIENNNNMMRGMCLNCEEDTTVYKCPKCGKYVNLELYNTENCREGFCCLYDFEEED